MLRLILSRINFEHRLIFVIIFSGFLFVFTWVFQQDPIVVLELGFPIQFRQFAEDLAVEAKKAKHVQKRQLDQLLITLIREWKFFRQAIDDHI